MVYLQNHHGLVVPLIRHFVLIMQKSVLRSHHAVIRNWGGIIASQGCQQWKEEYKGVLRIYSPHPQVSRKLQG